MSDFENKFESILVPFLSLLESNGADIDPYFYVPNQWNSEQKRESDGRVAICIGYICIRDEKCALFDPEY